MLHTKPTFLSETLRVRHNKFAKHLQLGNKIHKLEIQTYGLHAITAGFWYRNARKMHATYQHLLVQIDMHENKCSMCTKISTMKQVQETESRVHVTCSNWTLSIRAELFEIQEIQKQKQMSIKIHRLWARRRLKENCTLFSPPLTKTLQQKRCLQVSQEMAKTLKQQNKSCQQFQSLLSQQVT